MEMFSNKYILKHINNIDNTENVNEDNLLKSKQFVIKNNYWNEKHDNILIGLQKNSNKIYKEYQKAHVMYRKKLRMYRVPIIIMSGISGFLSISNSGYIPQSYNKWVSLFVGFINLMVTLISLIENFKKIDVNCGKTYTAYINFKKLHDEISLILNTSQNERESNGYDTIILFFNRYEAYMEDAPILNRIYHDFLDNNSPDNISQTIKSTKDTSDEKQCYINRQDSSLYGDFYDIESKYSNNNLKNIGIIKKTQIFNNICNEQIEENLENKLKNNKYFNIKINENV